MSHHRAYVLSLYRRCLRTAARSPSSHHAGTWITYCKVKFRDGRRLRSEQERAAGMADALEQVERMEYYQRVAGLNVPGATEESPHGEDAKAADAKTMDDGRNSITNPVSGSREAAISSWLECELRIPDMDAIEYASALVSAGFDDVQSVLEDVREEDLRGMGMKIGHLRRVLRESDKISKP